MIEHRLRLLLQLRQLVLGHLHKLGVFAVAYDLLVLFDLILKLAPLAVIADHRGHRRALLRQLADLFVIGRDVRVGQLLLKLVVLARQILELGDQLVIDIVH